MLSLVCSNIVVAVTMAVVKTLLPKIYNPYIRDVLVFLSDVIFVVLTFIGSSLNKNEHF